MSRLFKERHESFSPSEMIALYCRHLHEAVEVFDWKIRMKRLSELRCAQLLLVCCLLTSVMHCIQK